MQLKWICLFRIVGAFCIVVLHVSDDIVRRVAPYSLDWWTGLVVRASVQWAAPAFIMVSGALLLAPNKRYSLRTFYGRRAQRILLPLLFWSAFYLLLNCHRRDLGFSQALIWFFRARPHYHLWFLFVLAGLYLLTPAIRRVFVPLPYSKKAWLVVMSFALVALYTAINHAWLHWKYNALTYCIPYISYYCAGHVLHESRLPKRISSIWLLIVAVLCIATTVAGFYSLVRYAGDIRHGYYAFSYFSPWVILFTVAAFLWFHRTGKVGQFFIQNHRTSFGIYLVHPLILSLFVFYLHALSAPVGIPILAVVTFGASFALSRAMLGVPGLRRLV